MSSRLPAFLIGFLRYVPIPRFDPLTLRAANFAVRTTIASLTALYVALYLQLEDPQWAAVTVWVVGQPMRGMALSKSYYRFLGTLGGATMAIALTALFAQAPTLFIVAFAAWIGLCTAVATLLRNFKAYGAVLAGYTCGIIALAAYGRPEEVFDIAIARVTCISLGIIIEAMVAAMFVRSSPQSALLMRLRTICSDAAAFAAQAIEKAQATGNDKAQRILRDIVSLDTAVSYAAAEDQAIRRRAGGLRQIIISVMTAVSAAQALGRHIGRSGAVSTALRERMQQTAAILHRVTPESTSVAAEEIQALYEQIEHGGRKPAAGGGTPDPDRYFTDSRFSDMLGAMSSALRQTDDFFAGRPMTGKAELSIHRDYSAARINALRAFIAVVCAGAFWIASGWTHGQNFVRIVAVVCALYATRENPVIGSRTFFTGALVAGVVTACCHLFILPGISGYPLLVMLTAPVMITCGLLMLRPKTAGLAAAFNIYFISLLGISNTERLPFVDFVNDVIPLVLGVGVSVVVFMVVFPINLEKQRASIQRAALHDIAALAHPLSRMTEARWCSRMADRLSLLSAIRPPGNENPLMERALAAVEIGVQTIRLRNIRHMSDLPAQCRQAVGEALRAIEWLPRLGLVARSGQTGAFDLRFEISRLRCGNRMRDKSWLYSVLTANADKLALTLATEPGAAMTPEHEQRILQAIAALREIAEILLVHYIDRATEKQEKRLGPIAEMSI